MSLSALETLYINQPSVMLFCTKSPSMLAFCQDACLSIKPKDKDAEIYVESVDSLLKLKDLENVMPPFSDKWIVFINLETVDYKRVTSLLYKLQKTMYFVLYCEQYKIYKQVLDYLQKVKINYIEFYLLSVSFSDFSYLRAKTATEQTTSVSEKNIKYFLKNYHKSVETVWTFLKAINSGYNIDTVKDIEQICGVPELHTDEYVIKLLTNKWSEKPRGMKTQIKNQVKLGLTLGNTVGFNTFQNFLLTSIRTALDTKGLLLSNIIKIRDMENVSPNSAYDLQKIKKMLNYREELKTVPMSHIVVMYECASKTQWQSDMDFLNFIYTYIEKHYV